MNFEIWLLLEIFAFILLFTCFVLNALKGRFEKLKVTWLMPLLAFILFSALGFAPITDQYVVESQITDAGDMDPGNFTYEMRVSSSTLEKLLINLMFAGFSLVFTILWVVEGLTGEIMSFKFSREQVGPSLLSLLDLRLVPLQARGSPSREC